MAAGQITFIISLNWRHKQMVSGITRKIFIWKVITNFTSRCRYCWNEIPSSLLLHCMSLWGAITYNPNPKDTKIINRKNKRRTGDLIIIKFHYSEKYSSHLLFPTVVHAPLYGTTISPWFGLFHQVVTVFMYPTFIDRVALYCAHRFFLKHCSHILV